MPYNKPEMILFIGKQVPIALIYTLECPQLNCTKLVQ